MPSSLFQKHIIVLLVTCCLPMFVAAQQLSFRHLGMKEGMPSNVSYYACFDSTGSIWVSTNDGLVSYDGNSLTQYQHESHPGLPRNEIGYPYCDSRNRLWICTNEGLALVDEQRRIKQVVLHDSLRHTAIDFCFEVKKEGMLAIVGPKTFFLPEGRDEWKPFTWFDSVRKNRGISAIRPFDAVSYVCVIGNRVLLVDFKQKKVIVDVALRNATSVCRLSDHELVAVTDSAWGLYKINIATNSIVESCTVAHDQYAQLISSPCMSLCTAADNNVYITTLSAGLVQFNPRTNQFFSYSHDPLNDQTVTVNNLRRVFANKDGYLVMLSTNGVNFTNVLYHVFRQQNYFKDREGNLYDGRVIGIAEDKKGQCWLSTDEGIFIWKGLSPYVEPVWLNKPELEKRFFTPGRIAGDANGNMWVSIHGKGILVFDAGGKLIKEMRTSSRDLPSDRIRVVKQLNKNKMAVGSDDGFFIVDTRTFKTDSFATDPLLQQLQKARVVDIMIDGQKLWVATSPGGAAYNYDFITKQLKRIGTKEGLSSNRVYSLTKDSIGNIYIGTYEGLNIIQPDGRIRVINKKNGLLYTRVDNLVTDRKGIVWITNFNSLIRYDPRQNSFTYFDERNGVSNAGFTIVSNCVTKDGLILFGGTDGLLLVNPGDFSQLPVHSSISIHRVYDDNGFELLREGNSLSLPYTNAKLNLYFLAADLISANRYLYRYRLEGLDTAWSSPTKNHQVTYNLKPGKYLFRVQASYNETTWIETGKGIRIIVPPPFWQTWWFWTAVFVLLLLLVVWIVKRRIAVIKATAAVQQHITELESKALRAQMNPHFIFNSLNAIQELIVTKNFTEAYQYLSSFSKLLRMVLNNSEKNFIPLSAEIEMNRHYLQLESLRFKQSFYYEIIVEENIEEETTQVPSLLLQPFIENAIWHGLMHKEGGKRLVISFKIVNNQLVCMIDDNGIGRERAAAIKAGKIGATHFESKGTSLSQQRIETLNLQLKETLSIRTEDKKDEEGAVAGTTVIITIPKRSNFTNQET